MHKSILTEDKIFIPRKKCLIKKNSINFYKLYANYMELRLRFNRGSIASLYIKISREMLCYIVPFPLLTPNVTTCHNKKS